MERAPQIECDKQLHKSKPENRDYLQLSGKGSDATLVSGRKQRLNRELYQDKGA